MRHKKVDPWRVQYYLIQAEVWGEIYGEIGLGIHCEMELHISGLSGGRTWTVDHLATGRQLANFNAQARARTFVMEVAHLIDWNQEDLHALITEDVKVRLHQAYLFAERWKPQEQKKLLRLREQVTIWGEQEDVDRQPGEHL